MGFLRWKRKERPTKEQLDPLDRLAKIVERLSKIANPQQKRALVEAIEKGEEIPEYAWTPLPAGLDSVSLVQHLRAAMTEQALSEVRESALKARTTANADSHYLCQPFASGRLGVLYASDNVKPLFASLCRWGILNPFGPTTTTLTATSVPDVQSSLLCMQTQNPFSQLTVVYGLLPDEVSSNQQVLATLQALFQRNGSEEFRLVHRNLGIASGDDPPGRVGVFPVSGLGDRL